MLAGCTAIQGDPDLADQAIEIMQEQVISFGRQMDGCVEDSYRAAGLIRPAPHVAASASPQDRLLEMFGRQGWPATGSPAQRS
jgi:hypothetical protein